MPSNSFQSVLSPLVTLRGGVMKALSILLLSFISTTVVAQSNDSIYRIQGLNGPSKISGKVTDMTPDAVVVEVRGKTENVPAHEIRKIVFSNQPASLDRTRDRVNAGNFAQAVEELEKADDRSNPFVRHEIDWLTALSQSELAFAGSVTPKDAGSTVNSFLNKYSNSYYFYPATELKGRLLQMLGRSDLAAAEFAKMIQSSFPDYANTGRYQMAQSRFLAGDYGQTIQQCDTIIASSAVSEKAAQFAKLAQCLKAKAMVLSGSSDGVQEQLEKMIANEKSENEALFAAVYNAWGVYHFQAGRMKEAREKFLFTHLLFSSQADAHAESLAYLSKIWASLNNVQESAAMRELLLTRYRNSTWARQVN